VFNAKVNAKANGRGSLTARAKGVSANAAQTAANAAQTAATAAQTAAIAAQTAARGVSNATQTATGGVNKGVYSARIWAAPRLENAADYTTSTMAPRVSSALRASARQIAPADMRRRKRISPALTWSLLAAAVLSGAGAAAVFVRQRYRSVMAADTQDEPVGGGTTTAGTTNPPAASTTGTTESAATGSDGGANSRVSPSGR
jgi:hypothetical protein